MEDINNFLLENNEFNVEGLIKFIYSKIPKKPNHLRIHYKKYPEEDLVQIFTESAGEYTPWPIYNICRSIIFDQTKNKIVSYSHPNIEYINYKINSEQHTESKINSEQVFTESHEGTLISVFYHNNKWYYATRRHIDMYKTNQIIQGDKSEMTHGQMFEDALSKVNLSKEAFELLLNKDYRYNFELVHYQNKFNISYDSRYGEKYAKIFLLFVRDENQNMININMDMFANETCDYPTVIKNLEDNSCVMEGYIFTQDNHLCKVMHSNYSNIVKYNPGYKTKQEQYIHLYQNNLLAEYVDKTNKKIYTVVDTNNIEAVGMLSCVFTYIGQRMLDIYYKFNNNNMIHRNEDKFKELFNTKKYYLIFHTLGVMKGIHKNKQLNIYEMKTLLKYKISPKDMWKLFNELISFEETENILTKWSNPLVKMFNK